MKIFFLIFSLIFSCFLHAQIISSVAGNGTVGFPSLGGPAFNAQLGGVDGVAVDKFGNIYIADFLNFLILKIDTNGNLIKFAGNGFSGIIGDGGPATSAQLELFQEVGIVADSIGNIYFSDAGRVRKVNTSGIISTVAGTGVYGYSGDGGPATNATFAAATGLCFDKAGNLYIADDENSNIRMVNTAGIISTFAGTTLGFSGDGGPATNAQFTSPEGIAIDDSGNIYIADLGTSRVRKINTSGIITTVAGGNPGGSVYCMGCPATSLQLYGSLGVTVDHSGNIYASAISNNIIEKITQTSLGYTIAGTGTAGYSGDGGSATNAMLYAPKMICMDNSGNLLITDPGNHRLRKVWLGTTYTPPVYLPSGQFLVYPNPITNKEFTCKITTDTNEEASLIITNTLGQQVFAGTCPTNIATNFSIDVPPGIYFITAITKEAKMNKKLVVE